MRMTSYSVQNFIMWYISIGSLWFERNSFKFNFFLPYSSYQGSFVSCISCCPWDVFFNFLSEALNLLFMLVLEKKVERITLSYHTLKYWLCLKKEKIPTLNSFPFTAKYPWIPDACSSSPVLSILPEPPFTQLLKPLHPIASTSGQFSPQGHFRYLHLTLSSQKPHWSNPTASFPASKSSIHFCPHPNPFSK